MPTVSIAGQTIEVYEALAAANTYFQTVLTGASWSAATTSDRIKALVQSTLIFDRSRWRGAPTEPISKTQPQPANTQPIAWPRTGVTDRDGVEIADDTVPLDILNGYYEMANVVLGDIAVLTQVNSGSNVRRTRVKEKVDVIETENEIEYFIPTIRYATKFPTIVQDYIGFYLASSVSNTAAFAGGTDLESGAAVDWGTGSGGWP